MEFVLPLKLTQAPPAWTLIIPSISSTAGLLFSSDHLAHLARKAASAELGGNLLLVAPKTPSTEWHDKDLRGPPIFEGLRPFVTVPQVLGRKKRAWALNRPPSPRSFGFLLT